MRRFCKHIVTLHLLKISTKKLVLHKPVCYKENWYYQNITRIKKNNNNLKYHNIAPCTFAGYYIQYCSAEERILACSSEKPFPDVGDVLVNFPKAFYACLIKLQSNEYADQFIRSVINNISSVLSHIFVREQET